jgi:hypothetical protein
LKEPHKGHNAHNIAYTYTYLYTEDTQSNNSVTYLDKVPCGKPIDDLSLWERAKIIYKNIRDTLIKTSHDIEEVSIGNIFTNIKNRYDKVAQKRKEKRIKDKTPEYDVLLSDIFFWYVVIKNMFTNKNSFFVQFEPNYIGTLYTSNWEHTTIKHQILANIQTIKALKRSGPLPSVPSHPPQKSNGIHPLRPLRSPPPPPVPRQPPSDIDLKFTDEEHQHNPHAVPDSSF